MICPGCGFEQARGSSCQQCGTHFETAESGSESARPSPPTPPASKSSAAKHRNRPLHDLDMTISMPPVAPTAKPESSSPGTEAPSAKTGAPPKAEPEEKPHDAPPPGPVPPPESSARKPSPPQAPEPEMLCITASQIVGQRIVGYLGIVTASARLAGKALNESGGAPPDIETQQAHERAIGGLRRECRRLGGNAVVGVSCSPVFEGGGLWFFYSGTAVTVRRE